MYTILSPVGSYFSGEAKAVSLLADPQFTRAWPGGVGDRKMGSNYAPTIHVQKEAASKGLQQVLWLYGPDHQVTEVGTMNIFMFFVNDNGGLSSDINCRLRQAFNFGILPFRTRTDHTKSQRADSAGNNKRLNTGVGSPMGPVQGDRRAVHNA